VIGTPVAGRCVRTTADEKGECSEKERANKAVHGLVWKQHDPDAGCERADRKYTHGKREFQRAGTTLTLGNFVSRVFASNGRKRYICWK